SKGFRSSEQSTLFNTSYDSSSEAPLRGSVKATQPTLRPDQIVSTPITRSPEPFVFSKKNVSSQHVEVEAPISRSNIPEPSTITLTPDEAEKKWSTFLEETLKQRIAVGTMLGEANLIDVRNNMLRIGCPDD